MRELLTLGHCTICLEHRAILHDRIPISSVDYLRNFAVAKLDMQILSDNDVQRPNQFQSNSENRRKQQIITIKDER